MKPTLVLTLCVLLASCATDGTLDAGKTREALQLAREAADAFGYIIGDK